MNSVRGFVHHPPSTVHRPSVPVSTSEQSIKSIDQSIHFQMPPFLCLFGLWSIFCLLVFLSRPVAFNYGWAVESTLSLFSPLPGLNFNPIHILSTITTPAAQSNRLSFFCSLFAHSPWELHTMFHISPPPLPFSPLLTLVSPFALHCIHSRLVLSCSPPFRLSPLVLFTWLVLFHFTLCTSYMEALARCLLLHLSLSSAQFLE